VETVRQGIHPQGHQGHLYSIHLLRAVVREVREALEEAAAALHTQAVAAEAAALHIQAAAAAQAAREDTAAAAAAAQGHPVVHHLRHHTVAEAGDNLNK